MKASLCCGAKVKKEIWASKTIREIYYCLSCGKPCEVMEERDLIVMALTLKRRPKKK